MTSQVDFSYALRVAYGTADGVLSYNSTNVQLISHDEKTGETKFSFLTVAGIGAGLKVQLTWQLVNLATASVGYDLEVPDL